MAPDEPTETSASSDRIDHALEGEIAWRDLTGQEQAAANQELDRRINERASEISLGEPGEYPRPTYVALDEDGNIVKI